MERRVYSTSDCRMATATGCTRFSAEANGTSGRVQSWIAGSAACRLPQPVSCHRQCGRDGLFCVGTRFYPSGDYLWVIQSNKPASTCSHPTYSRTKLSARWRHSHAGTLVSRTRFRNAERRMSASKVETATGPGVRIFPTSGQVIAVTLAKALEQFARGLDCASGVVHTAAK